MFHVSTKDLTTLPEIVGLFPPFLEQRWVLQGLSYLPFCYMWLALKQVSLKWGRWCILWSTSLFKAEAKKEKQLYYCYFIMQCSFNLIGMTTENQKVRSWFLLPLLYKKRNRRTRNGFRLLNIVYGRKTPL